MTLLKKCVDNVYKYKCIVLVKFTLPTVFLHAHQLPKAQAQKRPMTLYIPLPNSFLQLLLVLHQSI